MGTTNRLGRHIDELVRISFEIVQPFAVDHDACQAPARELRFLLEVGEQVGKLELVLVEGNQGGG